jgi:5-methyltetrahydrofolate--homocysteine methyltransferase
MEESRRDGIETIEGIRRIKAELPGVYTVLGLSNVSFGLNPAARQVLNSVFLHECVEAGLDAAIVHASKILPLAKIDERAKDVCLDLIYDRRTEGYDPLSELLTIFEGVSASSVAASEDRSGWTVEDRLEHRIIDGDRNGIEADLDEAMAQGLTPLIIINEFLLAGMKTVGERFASGEMQLPFVLGSAETMKTAVAYLEPFMEKADQGGKGTMVLATVKGDVHDIGKNLVDIILTNNGYTVRNLGIKIGIAEMVAAVEEFGADAIGMSGLLVKSTLIMRENLEELNRRGLSHIPVILGGAALTRTYVERDLRQVYDGRLFYGKDAFEGLRTMDRLVEMRKTGEDDPAFGTELGGRDLGPRKSELRKQAAEEARARGEQLPGRAPGVVDDNPLFPPPFVGSRVAKGMALDDIAAYLNETALFRNQWGFRPEEGEDDPTFKDRVRSKLREELATAKAGQLLVPQVAWGHFAANADGDDLVIWTDESRTDERTRFAFPRQVEDPYLCISDFYRTIDSGAPDFASFQVVTMGSRVSEEATRLFAADEYQQYLYLHGLGVEMAEALAEYWHRRIREELGFADQDGPTLTGLFRQKYRGGRYSWGYPACPRLEDNAKVVELLGADRIGVEVSEGFQLHPEQSTTAIICHHPQAKYFVA